MHARIGACQWPNRCRTALAFVLRVLARARGFGGEPVDPPIRERHDAEDAPPAPRLAGHALHLESRRGDAAPGRVPGVPHSAIQPQACAGIAAQPVRCDHQVEPFVGPVPGHDRSAVCGDLDTSPESERAVGQRLHERAAQFDTVEAPHRRRRPRGQRQEPVTRRCPLPGAHPGDRVAADLPHRVTEPDRVERAQGVAEQREPGPDRARLVSALVDDDVVPVCFQSGGSGEPADPCTDHRDTHLAPLLARAVQSPRTTQS